MLRESLKIKINKLSSSRNFVSRLKNFQLLNAYNGYPERMKNNAQIAEYVLIRSIIMQDYEKPNQALLLRTNFQDCL